MASRLADRMTGTKAAVLVIALLVAATCLVVLATASAGAGARPGMDGRAPSFDRNSLLR